MEHGRGPEESGTRNHAPRSFNQNPGSFRRRARQRYQEGYVRTRKRRLSILRVSQSNQKNQNHWASAQRPPEKNSPEHTLRRVQRGPRRAVEEATSASAQIHQGGSSSTIGESGHLGRRRECVYPWIQPHS
ncbi:Protein of unknown function [Pyronema omphalodes CBS 100304]|uniref:Uncharacterized protein n=1 Tax=Pyronema omphalodes (strain CBS 100304) TaxID=1076935 RepID=U4LAS0_PYROM|nr:Protein of unknown function [Pyronema omphalodes CBS 100304]